MLSTGKHLLGWLVAAAAVAHSAFGASSPARETQEPIHAALYAANNGDGGPSVTAYGAGARGCTAPFRKLAGQGIVIENPGKPAFNSAGHLFIPDQGESAVFEYAPGAQGNMTPINTIGGDRTEIGQAIGVALDRRDNLFVTDLSRDAIHVFGPEARFHTPPIRRIIGSSTRLSAPTGVAIDSIGRIFVANTGGSITEYPAGASGDVAPIAEIRGPATGLRRPSGVALDAAGHIFVADGKSIIEYAKGATGNAPPIATIAGDLTGLEDDGHDVVVDATGTIAVNNYFHNTITEFASGANGNVAPITTISGRATGVSRPSGLALATPAVVSSFAGPTGFHHHELRGIVTPNGSDTQYYFQYGPTTSYGQRTPSTSANHGTGPISVKALISTPPPGTTHFQLVASNAAGTKYSRDRSFQVG
ncbi:MAG: hypothetical protein QOJ71_1743 [Actinomycetota bacterium]|nr:hypothetical protein [Actinomycetota bacterium]